MDLKELKKLRQEKFLAHKMKKKRYYLNKKQEVKKIFDYELNKEKRLEYDKEYREKRKEELKEYRKEYYRKVRENKL